MLQLRPLHREFVTRFTQACQDDRRVVAAFLGGSYAKGRADLFSDVDLCVITTQAGHEEFCSQREAFLRQLGDLVFLEDFGHTDTAFYIFADGVEGELNFGSEDQLDRIHSGSFHILLDKKNILEGAVFSEEQADPGKQREKLRAAIFDFWHELSHFITAMGRDRLWWARGQLDALRAICVNLVRLHHDFLDGDVGEEPYFKIEYAMPVHLLDELKETFCPLEKQAMLESARVIIQFYTQLAPSLAQTHGIPYPQRLEKVILERMEGLAA